MRLAPLALAAALLCCAAAGPVLAEKPGKPAAAPKAANKSAKHTEASLKALEARLAKNPKDAKLKLEVAEASYQVGRDMMYNPELPPFVKYRGALKHFRRTLALNPKHAKAAADKKQIEDIYRSMGRPIPE